ncbi:recombinase family protein [Gryllotalpicola protaetiae]|uniref:Recombinase family protein n=1 Tax=Gryllotalpicola protaetiae TaxID=2419771 RepID=A0A387BQP1_9MICO|nr:recombinase family protein [Gryllotalpicola protaetiae]AYG03409.1 recombinase family protein [Gryllotalpicola protaetiae]
MALVGYVRVSTAEQTLALQQDAMAAAGVEKVFKDVGVSGSKTARPGLDAALDYLRDGDTLVVWRLDRFSRSTVHALTTIDDLGARGVGFRSLTEQIDTSGPMGRVMLTLIAAFAQLERDVIRQRTVAGLEAARARGRVGGRPKALNATLIEVCRARKKGGATARQLATELGVSVATVYRALA